MASLSTGKVLDMMSEPSSGNVVQLSEVHIKEEAFDSDDNSLGAEYNAFHNAIENEMEKAEESGMINDGSDQSLPIKSELSLDCNDVNSSGRSPNLVYRCKYCGQQLQKIETLLQHEDAHRNGTIYKCRYCEYYTVQRERIKAHERKHTGEKPFSCDICDYCCSSQGDLNKHIMTHSSVRKFQCPLCPFRSKQASGISRHMRAHSEDRPFHCDKCDGKFKRKASLENHMKLHSSDKPFKCDKCSYSCKTSNLLRLHGKTHSDVRNFPCTHEGCQQRCKTRSDLVKHMSVHVKALDFKCVMCNKMFKSKQSLLVHTRRHVRKDLPCPECGKILHSKQSLSRHVALHFEEKKHFCHVCGHKFSSVSNLKNHLRVHDELRSFQCPLCVSGYKTANHLFTHIGSVHSKGYVYFCELCHKPFSRYIMIKTHIERNHIKTDDNSTVAQDEPKQFVYNKQCCESSAVKIQNEREKIPSRVDNEISFCEDTITTNSLIDHQRELDGTDSLPVSENLNDQAPVKEEEENSPSVSLATGLSAPQDSPDGLECVQTEGTVSIQSDSGNGYSSCLNLNSTSVSLKKEDPHTSAENESSVVNDDENYSPDRHTESELCRRKLIVKLERLPDSNLMGSQSSSEQCGNPVEENFDKIVRLGTYASVGIFLAGRNSGMKFNFKRGKKSNFSKWFMKLENMTPDAAERTQRYLNSQANLSLLRKVKPKRRRKKKSPCKKQFPKVKLRSTSPPRSKKTRKIKLHLRREKSFALQSASSENKSVTHTDSATNFEQISGHTFSCSLKDKCKSSGIVHEKFGQSHCFTNNLDSDSEQSCVKKIISNSKRKTAVKRKHRHEECQVSSLGLREVPNVTVMATVVTASQGIESGTSHVLSVPPNGPLSIESKPVDESLVENGGGTPTLRVLKAGVSSVVIGVEKVVDSPIKITWKKVGSSRKARCNQTQLYKSCLNKREEAMNNGSESVNQINKKCEQSDCATEQATSTSLNDFSLNQELPINETISDSNPVLGSSDQVQLQQKETESLPTTTKFKNADFETEEPGKSVEEPRVQVLSLEEFEEEYRKRPKIVAQVSLVQSAVEVNLKNNSVNRKRKKGTQRKPRTSKKLAKSLDESAVDPGAQIYKLQNEIFQDDISGNRSDCTDVKNSSEGVQLPHRDDFTKTSADFIEGMNSQSKKKKPWQSRKRLKQDRGKKENCKGQTQLSSTNGCDAGLVEEILINKSLIKVNSVCSSVETSNPNDKLSSINSTNKSIRCVDREEIKTSTDQQIICKMGKRGKCKLNKKTSPQILHDIAMVSHGTPQRMHWTPDVVPVTGQQGETVPLSGTLNSKKKRKNQCKENPTGMVVMSIENKNWTDVHSEQDAVSSGKAKSRKRKQAKKDSHSQGTPINLDGESTLKKNQKQGRKKVKKNGSSRHEFKKIRSEDRVESFAFADSGASLAGSRIKLPGLLSDDYGLRRQTVECVTLLPKVVLSSLMTTPFTPSNSSDQIVFNSCSLLKNQSRLPSTTVAVDMVEENHDAEVKTEPTSYSLLDSSPVSCPSNLTFSTSFLNHNVVEKNYDAGKNGQEPDTLNNFSDFPQAQRTFVSSCSVPENALDLSSTTMIVNLVGKSCDNENNEVKSETPNNPSDSSPQLHLSSSLLSENQPGLSSLSSSIAVSVLEKNCDNDDNEVKTETPDNLFDPPQKSCLSPHLLPEDQSNFSSDSIQAASVVERDCAVEDGELKTENNVPMVDSDTVPDKSTSPHSSLAHSSTSSSSSHPACAMGYHIVEKNECDLNVSTISETEPNESNNNNSVLEDMNSE